MTAIVNFAAPTYAAFEPQTNTLYVLRPDECEPEMHTFEDGLEAQKYLNEHVLEAKTIGIASLRGLLVYRKSYCDEDKEIDHT